jgi:hypothetical protein
MKKDGAIDRTKMDRINKYLDEPPLDPKIDWICWFMAKFKTLDRQWAGQAWAETCARATIEQKEG